MQSSDISSKHKRWESIYNALVQLLQTQQQQLEYLVNERKLVQERFKTQHDHWVSDVRDLEFQLAQMKSRVSDAEMGCLLESAKSELFISLRQRESLLYKRRFEVVEGDLADFRLCFDYLFQKLSTEDKTLEDESKTCAKGKKRKSSRLMKNAEEEQPSMVSEDEVHKMKSACDKLTSEVSALLLEKDFVWNQLRELESNYSSLRKSKQSEVEQANEKIEKLLTDMEQLQLSNTEKDETIAKLQSLNNEKDETIAKLKANLGNLEADSEKRNKEISRLSKEVELLRNSRGAPLTPELDFRAPRARNVKSETMKSSKNMRLGQKRALTGPAANKSTKKLDEKESKGSKRKELERTLDSTPTLFSSSFKLPKLKIQSPCSAT